jgi:hypothetical protein
MQYIYKQQQGVQLPISFEFHEKLYTEFFAFAAKKDDLTHSVTRFSAQIHQQIRLGKHGTCVWCSYKRKQGKEVKIGRSQTGCSVCNVALCPRTRCWEEFHGNK